MNRILFKSVNMLWQTPDEVYKSLDDEFHFDFDPCPANPTFDGLNIKWGFSSYCNPPYGRQVGKWISKGVFESLENKTVVFLLPARTDTRWFHDYILPYAIEIRFIKGRLKFKGAKHGAPFPSMIVIFKETR